jgi:menaquinone-dependent protoporphyrinogen oxidase
MGHWLQAARHLAAEEKKALLERPVWLFSSGPIGDPPFPDTFPGDVEPIAELTHARAHRLFGGKLDRSELGVLERAMVRASHAPEGDYRDWDDVREFADEIADALSAPVITG